MIKFDNKKVCKFLSFFVVTLSLLSNPKISFAFDAEVNVPEKYSVVKAGERLNYEIQIKYPENRSRVDLRLDYAVIDENNNLITQSKSLKAIETQASFVEDLVIPDNTEKGIYTLIATISDYDGIERDISTTFHVESNQSPFKTYFIVLFGAICFVGLLTTIDLIFRIKNSAKNQ